LKISNISKSYGDDVILNRVSFILNPGERVGLIGPNGCGKTTLLKIIAGDEQADGGSVQIAPPGAAVGYLAQGLEYKADQTMGDVIREAVAGLEESRQRMRQLEVKLGEARQDELPGLLDEYAMAQAAFEARGGYEMEHRIDAVLDGLGLREIEPDTPVDVLSGGQKTRLGLARLLLTNPHILLLDEPTNHLDIEALEWLETFLHGYPGAILIVSHDRTFLDNTVSRVLELDDTTHAVAEYPGNYSDYEMAKARELEKQWQQYKDQQERMAKLQADIGRIEGRARGIEQRTIHFHYRKIAKKMARQAVVRRRKLHKLLDSEERVEKPQQSWQMKLEFGEMPRGGQDVILLEGVGHAFDGRRLFEDVNLVLTHGERICLLGPNGVGKTTLLRIIAGELEPTEGRVRLGANVRLGYYTQEQEHFDVEQTPLEIVRYAAPLSETEARHFLHFFLFEGDDVFVPVGRLSYGERARLALAQLVLSGANCLLLDEPINHLDIPSRIEFEQAMDNFPGTVIAVVHDRYFIDRFATGVWRIEDGMVRK